MRWVATSPQSLQRKSEHLVESSEEGEVPRMLVGGLENEQELLFEAEGTGGGGRGGGGAEKRCLLPRIT